MTDPAYAPTEVGGPTADDAFAATVPQQGSDLAPAALRALDEPPDWAAGDRVLDRYEVLGVLGEGGMGRVFHLRHAEWNVEMAVKTPLWLHVQRMGGLDDFLREAEMWVGLGLHPHVVTCYFVRQIDGLPRVFAEYVAGGSLAAWIRDERLYAGGEGYALPRLLDLGVQIAWGLAHAQAHDLVHQDVKPANVMVTPSGTAKLTDFGLARATGELDDDPLAHACTPRYAAPEQLEARPLSGACDVFALGVTLVEMALGEGVWDVGPAAVEAWRARRSARVPVPPALDALIERCLDFDPSARPRPQEVAAGLRALYAEVTGFPHPRSAPSVAVARADALNNRAVSLLELGRAAAGRGLLDEALRRDGRHLLATYNRALLRWRAGETDDLSALRALETAGRSSPPGEPQLLAGWLHVERGDAEAATRSLDEAQALTHRRPGLQREVARALRARAAGQVLVSTTALGHSGASAVACDAEGAVAWVASGMDLLRCADAVERLDAHGNLVRAVAVSAEGRTVVTGAHDRSLRVWREGRPPQRLDAPSDQVWAVAVSADGGTILAGCRDARVLLWRGGVERPALEGHTSGVRAVALSADGRWAASGGQDATVRIWRLDGEAAPRVLRGHVSAITALWLSADGRRLLSGGEDRGLRCWALGEGPPTVQRLADHAAPVTALTAQADGRVAFSGAADGEVRAWDLSGGRLTRRFQAHRAPITGLACAADGRHLWSTGEDATLKRWRVTPLGCAAPHLLVRPAAAEDVIAHQAGFETDLGRARRALERGRPQDAVPLVRRARARPGFQRAAPAVALWARLVDTLGRGPLTDIWPLWARAEGARGAECAVWGAAGPLWGDWAGRVRGPGTLGTHDQVVRGLAAWGDTVLSVGADQQLRAWGPQPLCQPLGSCGLALCVHYDTAWVGTDDGRLSAWSLPEGAARREWQAHPEAVVGVASAPGGLLTASRDGTVVEWDLEGQRRARRLAVSGPLLCLCALPDGGFLAGDLGGRLHLGRRAESPRALDGHRDALFGVSATADGRTAATVGADGRLMIWDLERGVVCRDLPADEGALMGVALSPDGRQALTVGARVTLWGLDWGLDPVDPQASSAPRASR